MTNTNIKTQANRCLSSYIKLEAEMERLYKLLPKDRKQQIEKDLVALKVIAKHVKEEI